MRVSDLIALTKVASRVAAEGSRDLATRVELFKRAFPRSDVIKWFEKTGPTSDAYFVPGLILHFSRQLVPDGFKEIGLAAPDCDSVASLYKGKAVLLSGAAFHTPGVPEHEIGMISGFCQAESQVELARTALVAKAPHAIRVFFIETKLWSSVIDNNNIGGCLLVDEFLDWPPHRWGLIYMSNRLA